ncbi:30S ribosomal protein S9 [Candidatus Woesearchaeota archaeon]|nr:30S ribosomal protein S9 [Candidatus Woesearchaeota archaeon]
MPKIVMVSGKRKRAIARATIREGKGSIRVNRQRLDAVAPKLARLRIGEPLQLAGDVAKKVNITVNVHGGGWQSQTEATRLAIARGLLEFSGDKGLRQTFLDYDRHLLVADTRHNEPHKPNDSKPRKKRQKSYR